MFQDDSSDEKLPMTGRLTPIGGASSDSEYGRGFAFLSYILLKNFL
jgi:hypothetical protein